MNKIFKTGLRPREKIKPYNRACGAMEMPPIPASRDFHLKVKRLTTFCASLALLQNVFAVHPKGKHVTGFSVVYDSLRIQFLCHPGGGSLFYADPTAKRQPHASLSEANTTFLHNLRRSRAPLLRPIGVEPFEPFEPSEPSEPRPLCGLLFPPTSLDENMV